MLRYAAAFALLALAAACILGIVDGRPLGATLELAAMWAVSFAVLGALLAKVVELMLEREPNAAVEEGDQESGDRSSSAMTLEVGDEAGAPSGVFAPERRDRPREPELGNAAANTAAGPLDHQRVDGE